MKKYRIPENSKELIIKNNQPHTIIKVLHKTNDDWEIIEKLLPLEEINE